jgi:hypothetical protein
MQPPPFDSNVPADPSDALATSQPQLLNNFLTMFNAFQVNHVPLNAAANAGNHTIIQLLEQDNDFQTGVGEISVYVKKVENQTDQVFLGYQGNGQVIQYTNYQIYSIPPTNNQTSFFTFLPGGVIVYFGAVGLFNNANNNILNLNPPIAKHIITVDVVTIGVTPNGKYPVSLIETPNGIFNQIKIGKFFIPFPILACNYLVMANV